MKDIKGYDTFTQIEPIEKGWSGDKKYYVETVNGQRMLLRVSGIEEFERKKTEYEMMERAYNSGVLTSQPYGFGLCDGGQSVYSLSGWLDGEDVESALPRMSETEQYAVGTKAGEILRQIHALPAPENAGPWDEWFIRKIQGRIDFYNANPIKSESGDLCVRYLQENKSLLNGRPQTFNHGDFNKSNLMVLLDGKIGVIDFNSYNKDHGDPWWEFDPTNWGNEPNAYFCTGLIDGYFDCSPPDEFFQMHRYYLSYLFTPPLTFDKFKGGYGIDLFIGYPELWGKGIGTKIIRAMADYLIHDRGAKVVCADPEENNKRSVACWQKAGFVPLGKVPNIDDPGKGKISILMAFSDNQQLMEEWRAAKV